MRLLFFTLLNLFVLTVLSSQIAESALIKVEKDGRTGWIDHNGQIIVPLKYDRTREFSEEIIAVNQGATLDDFGYEGGKWGYCNRKGVEITPPQFDEVADFKQGLAAVKKGKKYAYVNTQGKVQISFRYDYASDFSEGLAAVESKGKWGFINRQGEWVISGVYDHASAFQHGLAIVFSENFRYPVEDYEDVFETQGKYGLIDRKGKLILDTIYDELGPFINGYARVRHNSKEGFVDSTGKIAIPLIYDQVTQFSEGLAAVAIRDTGSFTKPEVLDSLIQIAERLFEGWSLETNPPNVDFWMTNPIFTALSKAFQQREYNALKFGYIDQNGKMIVSCQYSSAEPFFQGFAQVHTGIRPRSYGYRFNQGEFRMPILEEMAGVGVNLIGKTGKRIFSRPSLYLLIYRDNMTKTMGYEGTIFYQNGNRLGISNFGFKQIDYLGYGLFEARDGEDKFLGLYSAAGLKVLENSLIERSLGFVAPERLLAAKRVELNQELKYGIIDLQGKWVVEPIYDKLY